VRFGLCATRDNEPRPVSTSLPITHLPECREPCDLARTALENPSVEGTVTGACQCVIAGQI
jgi:hypothetical protein